ncbi:MAG: hypothetical protein HWE23_11845 [Rhodobacteraceae bacterium]|nr:hypothetical protein [Paracoccaceae bacterium]
MSKNELTKQDEDLSSSEFEGEELKDNHQFGSWPEVVGLVFTLFVCWLIFNFRG